MKRIEVTDKERELAQDFAIRVIDTNVNHYARRNQSNKDKIINDITVGKIAEYAAAKMFLLHGIDCTEPDITVYGAKKKSFDADLIIATAKHIHVKSQLTSSARRYGKSWMFQKTDKLITKPKETDYILVCNVDDSKEFVVTEALFKANEITHLYGEPKVMQLSSKKALYWDTVSDIKELNYINRLNSIVLV